MNSLISGRLFTRVMTPLWVLLGPPSRVLTGETTNRRIPVVRCPGRFCAVSRYILVPFCA